MKKLASCIIECINPSNSLELCDGTMVTSGDSAEFYFENYNGDESNRLSFVGSTDKDYLIFQAEGPLAAELREDFKGVISRRVRL